MSGFREAVAALYRDLGPGLLAYARSLVGDPMEAEDAVQQVFLKLNEVRAEVTGEREALLEHLHRLGRPR